MNGGSVRKGKPHELNKAKATWRYECMQFVLRALRINPFNECCAYSVVIIANAS